MHIKHLLSTENPLLLSTITRVTEDAAGVVFETKVTGPGAQAWVDAMDATKGEPAPEPEALDEEDEDEPTDWCSDCGAGYTGYHYCEYVNNQHYDEKAT